MSVVAIIPARMASSRFPGKPLADILGLSMIEHVRRRVSLCSILDDVVVATCDEEIANEVRRFKGKVIMTSDKHQVCIDRIAEAAESLQSDIIINVQGDMPFIDPISLENLIQPMLEENEISYTDMMGPIVDVSEINNSNVVKVVFDKDSNALYYSREPIPSSRKISKGASIVSYKQFGVNAFRRGSLFDFTKFSRTPLEIIESVDMLRVLENGLKIRMVSSSSPVIGVDTENDLFHARDLMEEDQLFLKYKD